MGTLPMTYLDDTVLETECRLPRGANESPKAHRLRVAGDLMDVAAAFMERAKELMIEVGR